MHARTHIHKHKLTHSPAVCNARGVRGYYGQCTKIPTQKHKCTHTYTHTHTHIHTHTVLLWATLEVLVDTMGSAPTYSLPQFNKKTHTHTNTHTRSAAAGNAGGVCGYYGQCTNVSCCSLSHGLPGIHKIHMYMCTYMCIHVYVCTCTHICVFMYTYVHVHIYVYSCVHMYIYIYMCIHVCRVYIFKCIHMHKCVFMYTR